MSEIFSTGLIIDVIIVCVLVEWIAIVVHRSRTGGGIAAPALAGNLLAGVFLMLALRSALVGAGWQWTAIFLALALPAHLYDLSQRWTHQRRDEAR